MKPLLLYITDSDGLGGAEGYLQTLMTHVDRGRYRVGLLLPNRPATRPLVNAAHRLNIQVCFFDPIHQHGLKLRVIAQAIGILRRLRPTLVHFNLPAPRRSAEVMIAAALLGVPCRIATFQLVGPPPAFGRIGGWLRRLNRSLQYRGLDHGIAVSNDNRRLLIEQYGFPADRLTLIPNAIDPLFFRPQPTAGALHASLGLPPAAPLIGIAARLTATKGQSVFLTALPLIWDAHPDAHVLLAGTGEQEAILREQAALLPHPDQIHFLGALGDIRPFLAELTLFVLPSLAEGLPFALLEAMAMERAIVASTAGGMLEAVIDGVTGLLVPPHAVEQLAQATIRLLDDPLLRERMGQAGRKQVLAQFDQHTMLERTFALYDRR